MLSQIDKKIVSVTVGPHIERLLGRKPPSGPRIAVIGNCQSYTLAYAMKLFDPTARVDHYSAIRKSFVSMDRVARTLSTYDHVFMQNFAHGVFKNGGDWQDLKGRLTQVTRAPTITFAAFQPDLIYLLDHARGGAHVNGPLRPYHSALVVFAYRIGLSPQEANALFNKNVFEAIGYFDVWNAASEELLTDAKNEFGLDLSADLMNWSRRGVFMYSVLHPKPYVLATVARRLFEKAKLQIRHDNFDEYTIDDLARSEIFPVYPEIAERFGARGSYVFKCANYHISNGVGDFLTLPEFLAGSYAIYKRIRPELLSHARVDGWLADADFSRRLVALAQENLAKGKTPLL